MKITDKDRIDFIDGLVKKYGTCIIEKNKLIGSQPGMEKFPFRFFSDISQYQYGKTIRNAIDNAIKSIQK